MNKFNELYNKIILEMNENGRIDVPGDRKDWIDSKAQLIKPDEEKDNDKSSFRDEISQMFKAAGSKIQNEQHKKIIELFLKSSSEEFNANPGKLYTEWGKELNLTKIGCKKLLEVALKELKKLDE